MVVDQTVMLTTPWNPYSAWDQAGHGVFQTQFNAETTYVESNIPGSDTDRTHYSSMQAQQHNGAFTGTLPPLGLTATTSRYATSAESAGAFQVWTR